MEIRTRLTAGEGRRFAFTVGPAFLVIAGLSWWRGHQYPPIVLGALGVALLLAGLVVPGRLTGIYNAWMRLAGVLSKVVSPVVVAVMYFIVMTPVGAFMRLIGKNPLRQPERDGGFWIPAPSGGRSSLEDQF
jgi:hypothetical protein